MNTLLTARLISLKELALMAFAILLLAAAPERATELEATQQPVNITVPAEQIKEVEVNQA